MGGEELQGPGPSNIRSLFLVPVAVVVHKGVVCPRVTVKLVWYAKAGQLCIELGLVFRRRICVYSAKMEENGTLHATSPVEWAFVSISPWSHDVAAEKWDRRFEVRVDGGCQPGSPAALAKAGDA